MLSDKEIILASLKKNNTLPATETQNYQENYDDSTYPKFTNFKKILRKNKVPVIDVNSDNVTNYLGIILKKNNIKTLIFEKSIFIEDKIRLTSQDFQIVSLPSKLHYRYLNRIDASIVSAKAGISETGSLVLNTNINLYLGLTIIPKTQIIVVQRQNIYKSFLPALENKINNRNFSIISGKSQSLTSTKVIDGVHGADKLIILLWSTIISAKKEAKKDVKYF